MFPQAVIFDMDGLMFDTENIYTMVGTELMRRRGLEYSNELKDAIMGMRPQATFETMIRWHDLRDRWEDLEDESNAIYVSLLDEHLAPMPGLFELLDALETAGVPKAIATSSNKAMTEEVLSRVELACRFAFILTAEDVRQGKPHPEIYQTAARRFGLRPEQTLVLEDSQNGCRAAAAAGAFTVAVPSAHSRTHDFSAASLVVRDLTDRRLYDAIGLP
jgi:HAD superfamily hydrolase (TIGR01509 family)